MKRLLAAALVTVCAACAAPSVPPATVTITKLVPVYPPAQLYGAAGGCVQGVPRTAGTVADLANALIDERAAVDVCLGDRAALRQWRANSEAH